MPYILSPIIVPNSQAMWSEGPAYEKKNIYSIDKKLPPVNYDEHLLRPHSLTHLETPAHTLRDGKRLDHYYQHSLNSFYGPVVVIRLTGNNFRDLGNGIFHWIITKEEITNRLTELNLKANVQKLFVTCEYPVNSDGYHDPNYVLTLSQAAAGFLISIEGFNLYGTSWKSSDYNPGKPERPIHNTLFKTALVVENLVLKNVPEGEYFLSAFPIPLSGASEAPLVPVLFTYQELSNSR